MSLNAVLRSALGIGNSVPRTVLPLASYSTAPAPMAAVSFNSTRLRPTLGAAMPPERNSVRHRANFSSSNPSSPAVISSFPSSLISPVLASSSPLIPTLSHPAPLSRQPRRPFSSSSSLSSARSMKRFYKSVSIASGGSHSYEILLDGKKLKTPSGNVLSVPNHSLAIAVATEWESQVRLGKRALTKILFLFGIVFFFHPLRFSRQA